jgi:flavin-dependent dehydrogenase
VAKEAEYVLPGSSRAACKVHPGTAEIYFTADLLGYGWCVRKKNVMNVGLGRLGRRLSRSDVDAFAGYVGAARGVEPPPVESWRGHAYLAGAARSVKRSAEGIVVIGDAAGLASDRSGEGIGPAVESAIIAADVIADAGGDSSAARLARYDAIVARRWQQRSPVDALVNVMPPALTRALVGRLLRTRSFVEGIVLNRWFLHAHEPLRDVA